MATPALPFRLALAGASGLLLVGGVVGVVTVDQEDLANEEAAPAASDQAPTTTVPELADAAPLPAPPAPEDPAASTTTTTVAAPATTAQPGTTTTARRSRAAASTAPGPLVAPKVGSYEYEATSNANGAPSTSRITVTVEAAGSEGGTTLQDITIPTDQLGQRTTIRSRVAWGPSGAIVRRSEAMGADCVWQPPWPQYAGGLAVGRAWSYDTRCSVTTPVQATIERRGSRKVTGTKAVDAAGRPVATWTVAVDETTVITTTLGVFSVRSVGTEQLAPSLGVPVSKTESLSGEGIAPGTTSSVKLVSLP